jgi:hypothetical protein
MPNARTRDEQRIGKDFEGTDHEPIEILSRNFAGRIECNDETPQSEESVSCMGPTPNSSTRIDV